MDILEFLVNIAILQKKLIFFYSKGSVLPSFRKLFQNRAAEKNLT